MGDVTGTMVGFARTLRAAGVDADHERTHNLLRALDHLDVISPHDVYWAGRLTLCSGPDDLAIYDRCFVSYFSGETPRVSRTPSPVIIRQRSYGVREREDQDDNQAEIAPAAASEVEVLRHRDVARLSASERAEINRLLALLHAARAIRRSRRFRPAHRGRLDPARTIRAMLRRGGETARLHYRRHRHRPRRVVLLVDISGSMAPYADALLRLAHALERAEPGATEVFSLGTRLTRLTSALAHRDPDTAMAAAATQIPDWSGGTRLGLELKEFLDGFGQRGMARGAIVVIASDGWERGSPALLGDQMVRLSRLAYRVVWVNPHKGHAGYEPLTAGMRAALPYIDDFVEGHSVAAYQRLTEVLARA